MSRHGKMILILTGLPDALNSDLGLAISDLLQHPFTVEHPGYGVPMFDGKNYSSFSITFNVGFDEAMKQLHYDAIEVMRNSMLGRTTTGETNIALTLVELSDDNETVKEAWSVNHARGSEYYIQNRVEEEGGDIVRVDFKSFGDYSLLRGVDLRADCQVVIHDNIDAINDGEQMVHHVDDVFLGTPVDVEIDIALNETYEQTLARVGKAMKEADDQVTDPVQKSFLSRVGSFLSGQGFK
jgi:hypothetical protein